MIGITKLLCGVVAPGDHLRYGEGASDGRKPIVVWNTTRRCNLHCVHCYFESQDKTYPGELSTQEGKTFIDSIAQYGAPVLLFSGGEPLMRADLMELVGYAVGKGLRTVFSSNGTLISATVAREIKKKGVSYVGISLDGLEATNDRFRGKRGAFREALQGIHNCREAGLRVGLRFTITRHNFREVGDILRLLEEEDIPRCCFYHLVYAGRGSKLIEEDVSPQEARQVMDLVFAKAQEFHRRGLDKEILTVDNHSDAVYLYRQVEREQPQRVAEVLRLLEWNGGNRSGQGISSVDNLGYVHADQFWQHYSFGNVRERPFGDIWEDTSDPLMAGLKRKKEMVKGRCHQCRYLNMCAGNLRVRAEAVYGDVWAPDPACYLTDSEIGVKEQGT